MFSFFSRKSGEQSRNLSTDDNGSAQQQPTRFPSASPHPFGPEDSPSPAPEAEVEPEPETEEQQVEVTDPAPLCALISSVPPQTLHAYTLLHLSPPPPTPYPVFTSTPALLGQPKPISSSPPSPRTLTALTRFFSSLRPPPELHCVRCHKDYFEVDNGDSSCRVAHDDESADVEWVGAGGNRCSDYDTHYRCCDKTVEGEGDMGPPDGWCYEGRHTTDLKRARFRKDAYPGDDKLVSCAELRCHEPPAPLRTSRARGSSARKRNRQTMELDHEEQQQQHPEKEEGGSVTSSRRGGGGHARGHSKSASIASTGNLTNASISNVDNGNVKGKGRARPRPEGPQEEEEEEEEEDAAQQEKKRPTKRPRSRKPSTLIRLQQDSNGDVFMQDADGTNPANASYASGTPGPPSTPASASVSASAKKTTTAKKRTSKTITANKPKSPLSASFTPAAAASRASSTSPTRKGKSAVEVSIPLSRKGSLASLHKKQQASGDEDDREGRPVEKPVRAKPGPKPKPRAVKKAQATKGLGEIVDTSVDGEQWN